MGCNVVGLVSPSSSEELYECLCEEGIDTNCFTMLRDAPWRACVLSGDVGLLLKETTKEKEGTVIDSSIQLDREGVILSLRIDALNRKVTFKAEELEETYPLPYPDPVYLFYSNGCTGCGIKILSAKKALKRGLHKRE